MLYSMTVLSQPQMHSSDIYFRRQHQTLVSNIYIRQPLRMPTSDAKQRLLVPEHRPVVRIPRKHNQTADRADDLESAELGIAGGDGLVVPQKLGEAYRVS
jgi:hypothetical protein